jgi:hypothetical protein
MWKNQGSDFNLVDFGSFVESYGPEVLFLLIGCNGGLRFYLMVCVYGVCQKL